MLLAILTAFSINMALSSRTNAFEYPISTSFVEARGGIWVNFDVDEEALVSVIGLRNNKLEIFLHSTAPADKATIALGDGGYRVHIKGDGVLVSSSESAMVELQDWVRAANQSDQPLKVLTKSIHSSHPNHDIAVHLIN
jgi:hypothetical protein